MVHRDYTSSVRDRSGRISFIDRVIQRLPDFRMSEEVKRLIERIDCPVAVTADHGELLGEFGQYFHPNTRHPSVREVPWLEVAEEFIGTTPIEDEYRDNALPRGSDPEDVDDETFDKQLEALGYST